MYIQVSISWSQHVILSCITSEKTEEEEGFCLIEGNGKYAQYSMHKYGHETGRLHCSQLLQMQRSMHPDF